MHSLQLDQGFEDPSDLCRPVSRLVLFRPLIAHSSPDQIIRHPKLRNIRRLSILASWPYSSTLTARPARLFKFGLQLVPAPPIRPLPLRNDDDDDGCSDTEEYEQEGDTKRLDCFTFGLPLELSTNKVSRQHLALLAPHRLEITLLLQNNPQLMTELADLLTDKITSLSIRYLASDRTTHELPDPALLLSPTMDRFRTIDIHLPAATAPSRVPAIIPNRPFAGHQNPPLDDTSSFSQRIVDLISLDPDRRKRYAVWLEGEAPMGGFGPVAIKAEEHTIWEREMDVSWPVRNEEPADDLARGVSKEAGSSVEKDRGEGAGKKAGVRDDEADAGTDHWERETNLRLFGGLLSLRLESKKH